MKLSMYQVDAFPHRVFSGNPAAVCPLDEWLPDSVLQAIAAENNLAKPHSSSNKARATAGPWHLLATTFSWSSSPGLICPGADRNYTCV